MGLSPRDWRELASVFREGVGAWPPHWTEWVAFTKMAERCDQIAEERKQAEQLRGSA